VAPIALGAVLPDVPMMLFYAWQKGVLGRPERLIWSEAYWDAAWQTFFDIPNSLPLLGLAGLAAWRLGAPRAALLFASMAVHAICDLAVHHDDAHRHFLPLSDWRFASPVSYWDPAHYGLGFAVFEIGMVLGGCAWLGRRYRERGPRLLVHGIAAFYLLFIGYALLFWL
jgi:hypothetical protein